MDGISPPPPSTILTSFPDPISPGNPFNPLTQPVTFFGPDGRTVIGVPLPAVDARTLENLSRAANYGAQMGGAIIALAAALALTPAAKLRRPSALLELAALVVCLVRTALLLASLVSPAGLFYVFWAGDYHATPSSTYLAALVTEQVFAFLLTAAVEAALMHQAWTMVSLWPAPARALLAAASAVISLSTVGFRLALTVFDARAAVDLTFPLTYLWLMQAALVTNAASIFWFCALFNSKLLLHLVSNRGLLPSARTLSSIEVLIMTNGLLMVVPVVFAGLEWARFPNFESASLTPASVAIILPLGTLAAQRISSLPTTPARGRGPSNPEAAGASDPSSRFAAKSTSATAAAAAAAAGAAPLPRKDSSLVATSWDSNASRIGGCGGNASSLLLTVSHDSGRGATAASAPQALSRPRGPVDHFDLKLRRIDSDSDLEIGEKTRI